MSQIGRRSTLKVGAAGLLGLGLSDWLALEARAKDEASGSKASGMILIWLAGGPATIDMWDPKPDAPAEFRGEFETIETKVPGVRLTEPLARTAKILDRCVLVRSLGHGLPAHGPGTQYVMTGNLPGPAREFPSLGSISAYSLSPRRGMPPYVTLGQTPGDQAGDLGVTWNPFEVAPSRTPGNQKVPGVSLPEALPVAEFEKRDQLRRLLDENFQSKDNQAVVRGISGFQEQAVEILRSDRIGRAFDLTDEKPAIRDLYGRSRLAQDALKARRLIEAGARFVTIALGGFDTHSNNFNTLRNRLLPGVDAALAGLVADLDQRGLLDSTLVCCLGEFGRTPRVNGDAGRDHWSRSMAVFLAGGGLKTGSLYGATDKRGQNPITTPHTPDDLAATLLYLLTGNREIQLDLPSGRTVPAWKSGAVIDAISR